MVAVKFLDTVHKIYSTLSVENKKMDQKILNQIHTKQGGHLEDLSPRLKNPVKGKELRNPTS